MKMISYVPNETLLQIFKQLDSISLLQTMKVCHNWNEIANSEVLWKKLCKRTLRIIGNFTKDWCNEFSLKRSWKECYYWISKDDLKEHLDPQELCDAANYHESDSLRRKYLYYRGLDMFPDSPIILQQCADYLADKPDINNSWNLALVFYKKALDIAEKNPSQYKKILLFTLFRFAVFLASNKRDYDGADRNYKMLLRKLPGNPWVFEKYAEFLIEFRHKYNLAEKIYRSILNMNPTGSALISYALFLWQITKNYVLAGQCFKVACELDKNKIYVYMNFIGRQLKDEKLGKDLLLQSKLYKSVMIDNEDDNDDKIFSLALAFHQIHCVDEAEELYRKHMKMTDKVNICTLSNLAELLLHSRFNFEEAFKLYNTGLQMAAGANDTIEVALGSLMLAQNNLEEGLPYLYNLVQSSHIQASRNALTESWILIFIHCSPEKSIEALTNVKRLLVTEMIRPKLILMFDANLAWARKYKKSDYDWIKKLTDIYNCEQEIETLQEWSEWVSIDAQPPTIDNDEDDLSNFMNFGLDEMEENQTETITQHN